MPTEPIEVLESSFENLEQQREVSTLGMWVFLSTELMFFGALFLAYFEYRHFYPDSFAAASSRLNLILGSINTVILLSSSFTVALAVRAASLERAGSMRFFLLSTIILGAAFLAIKGYEYYVDYQEGLIPGAAFTYASSNSNIHPREVEMFFMLYFIMTSVHALHMVIGISTFALLLMLSFRKNLSIKIIENSGLYWHFVDVIWIFLFPLLYLAGHR